MLNKEKVLSYNQAYDLIEIARQNSIDVIIFFKERICVFDIAQAGIVEHHFIDIKKEYVKTIEEIPQEDFQDLRKVAFIQSPEHINQILLILKQYSSKYDICKVEDNWIEINPHHINKGTALLKLCQIKKTY